MSAWVGRMRPAIVLLTERLAPTTLLVGPGPGTSSAQLASWPATSSMLVASCVATLSLLASVMPLRVNAQERAHHVGVAVQSPSASAFLATAKEGTRRYASLDSAIADGYRRLGGDLPTMGEHWIHPSRVMFGRLDAARPSILLYVRHDGAPLLAGVAYTVVLARDAPYPDYPAGQGAWHEHNGTVDEETLPLGHAMHTPSTQPTRVAILHAWVWIENPRGVWTADNWMLPFVRAGLTPDSAHAAAARALSLTATGAVDYYVRVIATTVGGDEAQLTHARAEVERAATRVADIRRTASQQLGDADAQRLETVWDELWVRIAADGDGARAARVRRLHDGLR